MFSTAASASTKKHCWVADFSGVVSKGTIAADAGAINAGVADATPAARDGTVYVKLGVEGDRVSLVFTPSS